MRRALLALVVASCAVSLVACSKKAEPPAPAGIAWVQAAGDAEVDAAFARAKAEGKPVFVYWGAKWCPPCNQLKATLFNRQDFIERSRAFVPVYVDGDQPGAQKLGTRFAVRGYPTTIVFTREGRELTRLPGEVDAAQYNEVLALALAAQRPAKELLAAARAGGQGLADADWRLLAWYSWETDQQQLVGEHGVPALLRELAKVCPATSADAAMRLRLKALAAEGAKGVVADAAAQRPIVTALLADAAQARRHVDVLTGNPKEIVAALAAVDSPERAPLVSAYDAALATLQADATLSRADRLTALVARVQIGAKERLPALQAEARELAARFDREISDGYERQAVITTAAWMLEEAGALDDAKTLLEANLAKSHSPYYLMSELAANAKKRGDTAAALDWSAQAFEKSEGAATRLQWGAAYLRALVELAPQDAARIEALAARIIDEAAAQPDAFEARSGRSMQRVGKLLRDWDPLGERAVVLQRLQQRLDAVCAKLPAGGEARGVCEGALKPGAAA
ncbi:MAG: thioredoxin fold domain-containing protein [Piscinibacter sp.]|uniref:thioredoxin fold domain-containing protein n=1 Tax=Piscinibacter sp. TaxID=1903157 RepID=UPI001B5B46A0|nr:thioredoxin fold domain-containing protein [Piscinibacter sp.]MBP5989926.1 thioredoxin fold domain-containing protein [Piscinibacter sp.]MBP6026689.1 thioredoxin fold domain-containing protein [Piscinibacter sp.]